MNGGYFLVDAAGVNLTAEEAVTVKDLYDQIYRGMSVNKPICMYNVLTGEDTGLYTPLCCACVMAEGIITVHTYVGVSFTVSSADLVTIIS